MGRFLSGFVLPLLLLAAALLNWSLISLADLLAFLFIQYTAPKSGLRFWRQSLVSCYTLIFSSLAIVSHAIFYIVWAVKGDKWSTADAQWAKLIGFLRDQSQGVLSLVFFLVVQVSAASVALFEIYGSRCGLDAERYFWLRHSYSFVIQIGSHLRILSFLLLPAIQLFVGIVHPSWISLPFFICSSIGLVDWSLRSNFLGLFRWWRFLLFYAGLNITLLYIYQLPIEFSGILQWLATFIGLFKISAKSDCLEICSAVAVLLFYVMLSWIRCDLIEMDFIISARENGLTEPLLPSKHSFLIRESRSGVKHMDILSRGPVFRRFSVNFFAYGLPITLLALSVWSFHFASICAFGPLAYVGYILYAFPSMHHLHRLNGMLLVFILFWAISTYVFNVAFTVFNKKPQKDMEIWETIGLWHYPIPGLYLLAQFCLGVLVALGNLVNNSVFLYISDGDVQDSSDGSSAEEREETKVLIVATIAWVLGKISRPIVLSLLFLIAVEPGIIHSLYIVFFMLFLLCHKVDKNIRQLLVLLCEAHFALLYVLQLNQVSKTLEQKGWVVVEVLSQLGLSKSGNSGNLLNVAVLACFCSVHNHGHGTLFSFSTIVQHFPRPPVGFNILRAGLLKSVQLSVYTSASRNPLEITSPCERRIVSYLSAIRDKFLSTYRSCGTVIAFLTILLAVYLVKPNYASFGYLFFLLLWLSGRQLAVKTRWPLWLPLKIYAVALFIVIYGLSVFSSLQTWLSRILDLSAFGYDREASMMNNVWESSAVLVVMQLYSYEREQRKLCGPSTCVARVGSFIFLKRLLILHGEKILYLVVFYASLSPISVLGLFYIIGLVSCSTLPKTSRIPSKLFLVYSVLLVMVEYLFQLWGHQAEMFPGQKYSNYACYLGLRLYEPGFWGVESGLRGKILVILACMLQYNVFQWLDKMPVECVNEGKWKEPCALFSFVEVQNGAVTFGKGTQHINASPLLSKKKDAASHSCPSLNIYFSQDRDASSHQSGESGGCMVNNYSYKDYGEGSKCSIKYNKKKVLVLRKERLQMQKAILKIKMKFWVENMFNLFGLEINMIALLLASFGVLNVISLLYIASLAACILLRREVIRRVWPMFVFLFASVFTLEYLSLWLNLQSCKQLRATNLDLPCNECWKSCNLYLDNCRKCWLGVIVDDPRLLVNYFAVFMLSCLKLRADRLSSLSGSQTYEEMMSQSNNASVLNDLSFETKHLWTILDYLRLYTYCHLLNFVLALVLITGTLEFDILHLGYLGFALVFFRMRPVILKKKNKVFNILRVYNFSLIVLSLAYQSPFVRYFSDGKCGTVGYISEVVGFYKYDYGFRITSRSALVEIIIFMLVSLQSFMFSSREFDYVSKYLEAGQIGALVRDQQKRAAWKTAQLQQIRKTQEQKRMRNAQVEKIKSEMLSLQTELHRTSVTPNSDKPYLEGEGSTCQNRSVNSNLKQGLPASEDIDAKNPGSEFVFPFNINESREGEKAGTPSAADTGKHLMGSMAEITEMKEKEDEFLVSGAGQLEKSHLSENPLLSAVHLIGDGVSQVQSLSSMAVINLVSILNIEHDQLDADVFPNDEIFYEKESSCYQDMNPASATQDPTFGCERTESNVSFLQFGIIFGFIWDQMRSNNDIVCYCCFVLVFLWNFSLLSMVYLAALFLYALCVNTGPGNMFWVIMLIYTEGCVLFEYIYQIIIQHCGITFEASILQELGFPANKITSSFVISNWPLFLVYLFTLLQSSLTARDNGWGVAGELSSHERRSFCQEEATRSVSFTGKIDGLLLLVRNVTKMLIKKLYRYWKSLTQGPETPPYFVQLSMDVYLWPENGIHPGIIEMKINKLLMIVNNRRYRETSNPIGSASKIRVQSIERSPENFNVALVVLEVLNASSSRKPYFTEWLQSLTPAADVTREILEAERGGIFNEVGFPYAIRSVVGGGKKDIDLYAYIFCADLFLFFLVAVFYQSVIKDNSEFLEVYQLEDQFPKEFVFILMVIFFLIVVDRIIYLCSFTTGKIIYYLFTLVLFTYSVTKYAWHMEPSHKHSGKFVLRAIYLMKAISLALQAIQIRFGIPHESNLYRQFLTSSISKTNYLAFRIYRALPFLYELRCVLDWSCTTTSLTMYDWLKLEDIHASLFLVKCDVDLNRAGHNQGDKQTKMTKFCSGICLFFIMLCVIWAPMLMYSSGNPTNIANPIKDASVHISIGTISGKLTLFETTLCEKIPWKAVEAKNSLDPRGYLDNYNMNDIQLVCCQADASNLWLVPQIVQARYTKSLRWNMGIVFSWQFTRDRPKGKEDVKYEMAVQDEHLPSPSDVIQVLNGTADSFNIYNVYPRFFRVTGSGDVRFIEQAADLVSGNLYLNRGNQKWWSFYDMDAPDQTRCAEFEGPMAIIVSEETPQGILGETLSKFSIWGLYITFVLAVGRFIRLQFSDLRMRIPYENLPSCDRLLAICEDIYAARAEGELEVEEVLYWTLVKIYRSPHMLFEYTKPD